jgi:transglycosylase-like protein with SLT domain
MGGAALSTTPVGAPKLLLGLPLGLLAVTVAGLISITVVVGAAGTSCETSQPVGGLSPAVPRRLAPMYIAAASRYGLGSKGPAILASINEIETAFGSNLNVSSAGAVGWMQFMPETWAAYGVDANKDGRTDPYDPEDAIFAAANYLKASGAPEDWRGAIFAYNHADWYVEDVLAGARRFAGDGGSELAVQGTLCSATATAAVAGEAIRVFAPRAFKPLPSRLWVGAGTPRSVDARIWPNAVWLLETFDLRVTAAREAGHATHGDGTALDVVPAAGRGWDGTARRAATALGWTPSCGGNGSAPVCPLIPAIQFVGYNGYSGHGDPAHAGSNAHLHVSWRSSEFGCPGLCDPRAWVEVFPWQE